MIQYRFITLLSIIVLLLPISFTAIAASNDHPDTLRKRGIHYMTTQRYSEALDCFSDLIEQCEPNSKEYYACLGNIANVYGYMGNLERCLHYQLRVYDEAVKNKERDIESEIVINLVGTYCRMGDLNNARLFFSRQIECPLSDITMNRYYFLYNQALLANMDKKFDIADYYHREAEKHARKRMSPNYVITQYLGIANSNLHMERFDTALMYANRAMETATAQNNLIKMGDAAALLEKIYYGMGNETQAAIFNQKKLAYSDSLFNRMQFDMAQNKLFLHENKMNEQRVDNLSRKINMQNKMIVTFLIALATLTAFIVHVVISRRRLRNSQRLLIQRNEELMKTQENARHILTNQYSTLTYAGQQRGESDAPESVLVKEETDESSHSPKPEAETNPAKNTSLNEEQIREIADKINLVMQDIDTISKSDFSLSILSKIIGSNSSYVSFVINNTFGKNFRSLLNEYRIREACRRLSDHEHYGHITIQSIYQDLGYSSPSSFTEAFKKINGMTPSVYQKLAKNA